MLTWITSAPWGALIIGIAIGVVVTAFGLNSGRAGRDE